ncbi:MAG: hypothetical protein WC878_01705 [Candidatus Paceibacterota bacterium]|jgi:hypothetical protein
MNTIKLAKEALRKVEDQQQYRCVKYSPITGNVYVYKYPKVANLSRVCSFVKFVELVSGTKREQLLSCVMLETDTNNEKTGRFEFAVAIDAILAPCSIIVDASRIVIVD